MTILLAKSLQGDKCNLYCALWLSLTGQKSCFCSVWHHDASRISRKGSASANSPADPPRAGAHHRREKVRAALPALIFAAVSTRFPSAGDRNEVLGYEGRKA